MMNPAHWCLKQLCDRMLFPIRHRELIKWLTPHLADCQRVLDLGASNGLLASQLAAHVPATFHGCDVHVQPKTWIPIEKYDGVTLPFEDESFDCVMMIDMLHHDRQPERVLREARRVSSRYLLIKDHYWRHQLDFWGLAVMDYIGNRPYGVPLPYNFLRESQWHEMLSDLNVEVLACQKFRFNRVDPCLHVIYKVQLESAAERRSEEGVTVDAPAL